LAHATEKQQVADNIWLNYFNDELHKRGIISTHERNKMAVKINSRKPPTKELQRKSSTQGR
jgi:hypothetical protein